MNVSGINVIGCSAVRRLAAVAVLAAACAIAQAAVRIIPPDIRVQMLRAFTPAEVASIEEKLVQADGRGVPVEILFPRLAEASRKRVTARQLAEVMEKKIQFLAQGELLFREAAAQGFLAENKADNTGILAELCSRRLTADEWSSLLAAADRKRPLLTVIERASDLVRFKEQGFTSAESIALAVALLPLSDRAAAELTDLVARYPGEETAMVVIEGLRSSLSISALRENLAARYRKAAAREVTGERRPER